MKKILIALSLFMMVGVAANAQKCTKGASKACCAKKGTATAAKADAQTKVAAAVTEAEIAAEGNENIMTRTCAESGSKSFYQKSVCEKSGSVSWNQVEFCDKSKKFTKVASASMEKNVETGEVTTPAKKQCTKGDKKCCSKEEAKKCCASKKAKATEG